MRSGPTAPGPRPVLVMSGARKRPLVLRLTPPVRWPGSTGWPAAPAVRPPGRCSGLAAKLVLAVVAGGPRLCSTSPRGAACSIRRWSWRAGDLVRTSCPSCCSTAAVKRKEAIGLELPDTLDQMTIAVEAGLGFESAMARAGRTAPARWPRSWSAPCRTSRSAGPAARPTWRWPNGPVPDLRRFIRAVVQADAYGISIADVLRTQAAEMRLKRRQRAEEKAMKIPVKVIFPLILCILPALFIVLLGPAAMDIIAMFKRM